LIYLVRHGQTEFNRDKRLQGQCDSPLTELGQEQARRMGAHLKALVDDHARWQMIASPLGRAAHTARIIRETIGLKSEIKHDPRIQELHVGEWEGFNHAEIEAAAAGITREPGWLLRSPGGERHADIAARVTEFLNEIDETDGMNRIVVSHGITGRILRGIYTKSTPEQIWGNVPPPQDAVFHLSGGAVRRIDIKEDAA
jgi:broad specificity phosphatase PhoE